MAQDMYLEKREVALRDMLIIYGEKVHSAAALSLQVVRHDVVAVAEVLPSLMNRSKIIDSPAPPEIDYRDESLILHYLIPHAWRGNKGFLSPDFQDYPLPETFDRGDNLEDFTQLPFQAHPTVRMAPAKRNLITLLEKEAVKNTDLI